VEGHLLRVALHVPVLSLGLSGGPSGQCLPPIAAPRRA